MDNPFLAVINSLLPEPQASLLSGMLFGVRQQMPTDLYGGMRDSGVLHVVALSGSNISILIDIVAKMTLFLGKKISVITTIIVIGGFVIFVGASPTIVRAAIMGSMSLIAIYLGRREWSLLSLFLASGVMLLALPNLIEDISFQLSFLATLGIILADGIVERKRIFRLLDQLIYGFKENLAMTLSAQLFTLPIIVLNFQRISLVAPLTNLLVGWVIQPIMVLGFMTAILGWIWLPLGIIPGWLSWVPLTYFLVVVEWFSKIPLASLTL